MTPDWSLLEELYSFVRARAEERLALAERSNDRRGTESAKGNLRMLRTMYVDVKTYRHAAAPGIDYFREKAMRDREHPDFQPEWTIEVK